MIITTTNTIEGRKVTDYLVYVEEVLGIGQYGKVCKAQK